MFLIHQINFGCRIKSLSTYIRLPLVRTKGSMELITSTLAVKFYGLCTFSFCICGYAHIRSVWHTFLVCVPQLYSTIFPLNRHPAYCVWEPSRSGRWKESESCNVCFNVCAAVCQYPSEVAYRVLSVHVPMQGHPGYRCCICN
jgi:hypothetical protein